MAQRIAIRSETFCRAVRAVRHCACTDGCRPHLNVISLRLNGRQVRSEGTDLQMVAVYEETQDLTVQEKQSAHFLLQLDEVVDATIVVERYRKQFRSAPPGGPLILLKHNKKRRKIVFTTKLSDVLVGVRVIDENYPPIEKVIPPAGRRPKFKHNFIGLRAGLVTKALKCFSAIGRPIDFLAWDFGGETDPVCVFKRYVDRSLLVIIMPGRMGEEDGRSYGDRESQ